MSHREDCTGLVRFTHIQRGEVGSTEYAGDEPFDGLYADFDQIVLGGTVHDFGTSAGGFTVVLQPLCV